MKVLIDIPKNDLEALNTICEKEKSSRSEMVRKAIRLFLGSTHINKKAGQYFGLWKKKNLDGVKFQQKMRSEW